MATGPAHQCPSLICTSRGEGAPSPVATSDFRLIRYVAHSVLQWCIGRPDAVLAHSPDVVLMELSEREQELPLAVGRGLSNAEIGAELYMSVATVKAHVSRLLTELGAANRVHVALLVHDAGPG